MSPEDTVERIVEFKLLLRSLLEAFLTTQLLASAKKQGSGLPAGTWPAVQAGVAAAVARLETSDLAQLSQGRTWEEAVRAGLASGAWRRLVDDALRRSFPGGPT